MSRSDHLVVQALAPAQTRWHLRPAFARWPALPACLRARLRGALPLTRNALVQGAYEAMPSARCTSNQATAAAIAGTRASTPPFPCLFLLPRSLAVQVFLHVNTTSLVMSAHESLCNCSELMPTMNRSGAASPYGHEALAEAATITSSDTDDTRFRLHPPVQHRLLEREGDLADFSSSVGAGEQLAVVLALALAFAFALTPPPARPTLPCTLLLDPHLKHSHLLFLKYDLLKHIGI
ncbi:hypothetical protein B0H11DRAFT_2259911 [Mycena galericulata]|nr:hypothetical protein B0H11DRAFT_2259911 [Mycena galericulata]